MKLSVVLEKSFDWEGLLMFRERVMSSFVIVLLMGLGMFLGSYVWIGLVMALILGAVCEYAQMLHPKGYNVPLPLLLGLAVLMVVLQSYNIGIISELGLLIAFVSMVVWLLATQEQFSNFAFGFMGYMMIAWTLSFLVCLEAMEGGWRQPLLAFVIVWATDAGAYCVGMLFGRHKLAPVISPKKSWEGAVGGVLCCLVAVTVYNSLVLDYTWRFVLAAALICSVAGQIGDLLESWLKRWAEVKDSGSLIPGHGGLMDRFDSMTMVAPLLYYLLIIYHSISIYF